MKSLDSKKRFEITVSNLEGLQYSQFSYQVSLNSSNKSLHETSTFEIEGEGTLTFSLIHNTHQIGGFSIPITSLTKSTTWFPATNPISTLTQLPNTQTGPRILLCINPLKNRENSESKFSSLEVFKLEVTQKDELIKELEKIIQKERKENDRLQHIVDELAENFYKFQAEHKDRVKDLLRESEEDKEEILKITNEKNRLTEEVLKLKRLLKSLESKKEPSDPCYANEDHLQTRLQESESKRKELQQLLNSSSTKWLDSKTPNNTLNYLEKENKSLLVKVKTLVEQMNESRSMPAEDENFMKCMHGLSSKLSNLKQKNVNLKEQVESLELECSSYKEVIEKFRNEVSKQASENSELSEQLKLALSKVPHREEKIDQIDKELRQYFKDKKMKNPFVKISEGVYNYGNKRLCFNLKNGIPVVRVGGGYMFIDEFLKMYHTHCKKKEEFPMRSCSLEGKCLSTSRLKQKSDSDEGKLNENDSPMNKSKHEIKMLKKVKKVFVP